MHEPQLHSLNEGFDWTAPAGAKRLVTEAQARSWDEQGFLVVEDAFDAATMQKVIATIDPFEAQTEELLARMKDGKLFIARAGEITFTTHLVARSAFLRDFAGGSIFQDLCHDLVGDDVRLYWDQAVYKKPATLAEFPWHQDNGYTFVRPQQYLTCWVSLTDATEENGCPWVAPGIHRSGTLKHHMTDLGWRCLEQPEGAIPVPVRAGSVVVFSSLTPHRTGPNTSEGTRKSYILQYAPDGARLINGTDEALCDASDRQFFVLQSGQTPR
ncbi:MAG: phytanoyl-CoA dioxygenase family protein [Deltaproteobacteria bacterium]